MTAAITSILLLSEVHQHARSLVLRWQASVRQGLVQDAGVKARDMARRVADSQVMKVWEEVSGGARAVAARSMVDQARNDLINIRRTVELAETKLDSIRDHLGVIREQLDQIPRTDSRYPNLVRDEHVLLRREQTCLNEITAAQQSERHQFESLCSALEFVSTVDNDRNKYFSIVATVLGTMIGAIGSSIAASSRQKVIHERLDGVEHALNNLAATIPLATTSSNDTPKQVVKAEAINDSLQVQAKPSQDLSVIHNLTIAATASSFVTLLYLFFGKN